VAVYLDYGLAGGAQGHVQHGAILGTVDPGAAEHRCDLLAQARGAGQGHEQIERLVGNAVLAIVEVEAGSFSAQPLAAALVGSKEVAQVGGADRRGVRLERLPLGAGVRGGHSLVHSNS
jgi:hypothetical protein